MLSSARPSRGNVNPLATVPTQYAKLSCKRVSPSFSINTSVKTLKPIVCPGMLKSAPNVAANTMTHP